MLRGRRSLGILFTSERSGLRHAKISVAGKMIYLQEQIHPHDLIPATASLVDLRSGARALVSLPCLSTDATRLGRREKFVQDVSKSNASLFHLDLGVPTGLFDVVVA